MRERSVGLGGTTSRVSLQMDALVSGGRTPHAIPYLGMGTSLYGLGVLGIVLLQAIAAAAIVGYFLRHRQGEPVWASMIAPPFGLGSYKVTPVSVAQYLSSRSWTVRSRAAHPG